MRLPSLLRSAPVLPLALALAACMAGDRTVGPSLALSDYVSGVKTKDGAVVAVYKEGAPPAAVAAPTLSVAGISSVINGGSGQSTVTGSAAFSRVVLSIPGYGGYYELTLPSAATSVDLLVTLTPNLAAGTVRLQYQAGDATNLGPAFTQSLRAIRVGNGDIQVSIAWSGATDIDLHVIDPSGEEIFFGNKTAASFGTLDLDSNPACSIDGKNNENVVWPAGRGATGTYSVGVVYYADCGVARSDWVVTVLMKNRAPQTFTGSFVGAASANPRVNLGPFTY